MEDFFKKHPVTSFSEILAVKMIHDKIECAYELLEHDKHNTEYCSHLAKAYEMLYDFFNEKGIDPSTLV